MTNSWISSVAIIILLFVISQSIGLTLFALHTDSGVVFLSLMPQFSLTEALLRTALIPLLATLALTGMYILMYIRKKQSFPALAFLSPACVIAYFIILFI